MERNNPSLLQLTFITSVLLLSRQAVAQEEPLLEQTTQNQESGELTTSIEHPLTQDESHARREAGLKLLKQANLNPQLFVGKTLTLENGKTVGEVLMVKRKLDNLFLYLIVDATPYFNEPTEYAVAVRDVSTIIGDRVFIELASGMHLRGLTYYPEDYTEAGDNFPEEALENQ